MNLLIGIVPRGNGELLTAAASGAGAHGGTIVMGRSGVKFGAATARFWGLCKRPRAGFSRNESNADDKKRDGQVRLRKKNAVRSFIFRKRCAFFQKRNYDKRG